MEPNYGSVDPEEQRNKYMAAGSLILGVLSLCAGLIPIFGMVVSLAGIGVGLWGRRSEQKKLAAVGIAISVLGLILSVVYAVMKYLETQGIIGFLLSPKWL
jgi:hypothetical protein